MDTERIRQRYRPDHVRLLLVGESPPRSGKFFYVKSPMTTYTAQAFERAHGLAFPTTLKFLEHFKQCGCFLDDLSHDPVDHLEARDRKEKLEKEVGGLSERINKANPPVIAIVLKKIESYVQDAIHKSGCNPKVHVLPFAGNGHQNKYIEELSKLVIKYLPRKK